MLLNQIYAQNFRSKTDSIVKIEIASLKKSGITEIGFTNLTCTNYAVIQLSSYFGRMVM